MESMWDKTSEEKKKHEAGRWNSPWKAESLFIPPQNLLT